VWTFRLSSAREVHISHQDGGTLLPTAVKEWAPRIASRRLAEVRKEHLIQYGVAAVTACLVLAPLVPVLYTSFLDRPLYDPGGILSLDNYVRLFSDSDFHEVIGNTLSFAILTTLISVGLGVVMAVVIGRTDLPGRSILGEIMLWPIYLSPLVISFAWVIMYSPAGFGTLLVKNLLHIQPWNLYTIPGMAVVAAVALMPIAYLYCSSSAAVADPALEDAARTAGAGPLRILFSVTLPLMRPPILYSAVLIFTIGLEVLSIPMILGGPVGIDFFSSFLYNKWLGGAQPDYGLVGAAAVFLLLIVTGLVLLQNALLRDTSRFVTVRGKATRPHIFRLGWLRWVLFAFIFLYVLLAAILPMVGLIMQAFTKFLTPLAPPWRFLTLNNVMVIFSYPAYVRSITNSIVIAVIGGVLTTFFVALIALVAHRSEFRLGRVLDFLAIYPRTMPGMIVGIGFFWAFVLAKPLGPIRNTIWALTLAFGVRYLPTAFGAITPMLARLGAELDDAARTAGADWWTTCWRILLKLLKPALYSSFILLFIQLIKEYGAAVFLVAPGSEVMGLTMLQFWVQGEAGPVAALSLVQVAMTMAIVYASRKLFKVKIYA
jgi:iron(III) transport system permease protein